MTTCFYLHGMPDIRRHTPELLPLVSKPPSVMRIEPVLDLDGFARRIFVTFRGSMDEGLSNVLARSGYHQDKPLEPEEDEKDGS